jgi:hypothetical protein
MAPLHVLRYAYTEGCLGALLYDVVFQPLHGRHINNEKTHNNCVQIDIYRQL